MSINNVSCCCHVAWSVSGKSHLIIGQWLATLRPVQKGLGFRCHFAKSVVVIGGNPKAQSGQTSCCLNSQDTHKADTALEFCHRLAITPKGFPLRKALPSTIDGVVDH